MRSFSNLLKSRTTVDFQTLKLNHNNHNFRAPVDLQMTPLSLRRGLVVGSCVAEVLTESLQNASRVPHDYLMYHSNVDMEKARTKNISDYDYAIVSLALRYVVPERAYIRLNFEDDAACESFFHESQERMLQWLDGALSYLQDQGLLTFVCTFLVPQQNPMGRLLRGKRFGNICYFIAKINECLEDAIVKYRTCYLLDVDSIANSFGKKYINDETIWLYNHGGALNDWDWERDKDRLERLPRPTEHFDIRVDEFYAAIWRELDASIRTIRQQDPIKMVVVDLDDTLWRGLIGEGQLHPEPVEGWPIAFAETLHYLKKRGIILGILSKNSDQVVQQKWDLIYDLLKLDDFAVRRINWRPKVENFEALLAETNLLPKNVLFIDDNPVERSAIKSAFPDVRVLGANPYYLKQILIGSPETQVAVVTDESSRRTEMIRGQSEREASRKRMSREEFLVSLGLKVSAVPVSSPDHPKFARALELINKTNQFNTTGKRWLSEDLVAFMSRGGRVIGFNAEDRFTNYGLISIGLVYGADISQLVMSCRVIGMEIEKAILSVLEKECAKHASMLTAKFEATAHNGMCQTLFESNSYSQGGGEWTKNASDMLAVPSHIHFKFES